MSVEDGLALLAEYCGSDAARLYRLLGLIRTGEAPLAAAEREEALHRLVRFYLRTAAEADWAVMGDRLRLPDVDEVVGSEGVFASAAAAMDWLQAERHNLCAVIDVAADHGWFEEVWRLCQAMWSLFLNRKHYEELRGRRHQGSRVGVERPVLGVGAGRRGQYDPGVVEEDGVQRVLLHREVLVVLDGVRLRRFREGGGEPLQRDGERCVSGSGTTPDGGSTVEGGPGSEDYDAVVAERRTVIARREGVAEDRKADTTWRHPRRWQPDAGMSA